VAAAVPTPAAAAPEAPPGSTATPELADLMDATFSGNPYGWPDNPGSTAFLAEGIYHLVVRTPGMHVAVGAPLGSPLGDGDVAARFQKAGGPPGGGYGIIVRAQPDSHLDGIDQGGHFYVFEVDDRGEVGVRRRDVDHWVDILPWTRSAAARPADAENLLTVQASGPRLTFLVNGTQVFSREEPNSSEGGVGVFAAGEANEVEVLRFMVRVPVGR
jgi:hypothetical protein